MASSIYFGATPRLGHGRLDHIRFSGVDALLADLIQFLLSSEFVGNGALSICHPVIVELSTESFANPYNRYILEFLSRIESVADFSGVFRLINSSEIELDCETPDLESNHKICVVFSHETSSESGLDSKYSVCIVFVSEQVVEAMNAGKHLIGLVENYELSSETAATPIYMHRFIRIDEPLLPGETLVLDSENFTVIKGTANVLDKMKGDFLVITPGINTVRYIDSESARTAFIQISYEERYA